MLKKETFFRVLLPFAASIFISSCASRPPAPVVDPNTTKNSYDQINLVANREEFHPDHLEPDLQNAWGLAIRPAGLGGHFWVTNQKTGKSIQYIGDVGDKKLYQDDVPQVDFVEKKGKMSTPTGVVFNPAKNFVIHQPSPKGDFESESKFIFATDSGRIYGWAEKKNDDGTFNRPRASVLKVDNEKRGDQYFGLAIDPKGERLYAADFGKRPRLHVFDKNYKEIKLAPGAFRNPFITGPYTKAGEYGPYNVQVLNFQNEPRVFVAYAQIEKDAKTGKIEAGEEQKGATLGRLVEYDLDGKLVRQWKDKGTLNAPWGVELAPATGFGAFSGKLLVGNFGDGTIVAFDPKTFEAIDYLKRPDGTNVAVEGLWAILFGNGVSLGEKDQLYFAAGPNDETDGIFGKIKIAK